MPLLDPRLPALLAVATMLSTASAAFASLPPCDYADQPVPAAGDAWHLSPVDTAHRLPADFVPPDLVPVSLAGLDDGRLLRSPVVDDLADLLSDATASGVHFELQSAYRSYEYQEEVFAYWSATLGREAALRTSARPGHSEHQLGTALDLRSRGGPAPWDLEDWAATEEGAWLRENAWRYGFVMSYGPGEEELTCYDYEPWHYRWIGRDEAARQRASGQTLREWLWARLEDPR